MTRTENTTMLRSATAILLGACLVASAASADSGGVNVHIDIPEIGRTPGGTPGLDPSRFSDYIDIDDMFDPKSPFWGAGPGLIPPFENDRLILGGFDDRSTGLPGSADGLPDWSFEPVAPIVPAPAVSGIPSPGGASLLILGGAMAIRRRRRS